MTGVASFDGVTVVVLGDSAGVVCVPVPPCEEHPPIRAIHVRQNSHTKPAAE